MSLTIYGALGLNTTDSSLVYIQTIGQRAIFDAVNMVLDEHTRDLDAALGVFIDETTSDHKRRYMLPGTGRLQRIGPNARPDDVKANGSWDVAFPLEDFGAAIGASRRAFAYMTMADLDRHLKTVQQQNVNTVRNEMLKALMYHAEDSFEDPIRGTLLIEPLANNDTVTYPPLIGAETGATENHYLESGYLASAISDTNDPFPTIVNELEEHFGTPTGGSNIVVFINNAQTSKVTALTPFTGVTNRFIDPGDDINTVMGLPAGLPGRYLGVHEDSGAVIVEWRWMPANYMLGIHLGPDVPKPLVRRVDPAYTGIAAGLQLVARSDVYPFTESIYSHPFGFGVGNRLNGVVMELGTSGSYDDPSL